MRKKLIVLNTLVCVLFSSCVNQNQSQITPVNSAISETQSTSEEEIINPPENSLMLIQNFESSVDDKLFSSQGEWKVSLDEDANHAYCNDLNNDWSHFLFGWPTWQNYVVEMRAKFVDLNADSILEIYSRIDTGYEGYRTSMSNGVGAIGNYSPPQTLSSFSLAIKEGTWYDLRIVSFSDQISVYMDGKLQSQVVDGQRSGGMAGVGTAPNTLACVDDIQVWALNEDGTVGLAQTTIHPTVEIVTTEAVTGDGGNAWGGHQTRIVRTDEGIFTAYTVEGSGDFAREWQLAWRNQDGIWVVLAKGDAGKDPVNLLASPDGTLHVIGWPNQTATMWSGNLEDGVLNMTKEKIPGLSISDWPYNSASVDQEGNICVLSSIGGDTISGTFKWACYLAAEKSWISNTTNIEYRYCYTYLFPEPDGQLTLVSTRDVLWGALGYDQPDGSFDYVFNAIGVWNTQNVVSEPLEKIHFFEEIPTEQYPYVVLNAFSDVYQDRKGNIHILYYIQGESTKGIYLKRHLILSPNGTKLSDVELPVELGEFSRIFQDSQGQFYILGSSGVLFPAGDDGITLGEPILIDLQGYVVESTGFGVSVPRTGTVVENNMDLVFPSNDGTSWIYFNLPLP